jgi:magnesium transporter
LSSDEESDSEDIVSQPSKVRYSADGFEGDTKPSTRQASLDNRRDDYMSPLARGETNSSSRSASVRAGNKSPDNHLAPKTSHTEVPKVAEKQVRYGERPVWWLDILCPTEDEMKVLSKAFGIHPLTAEDVMLQEAREKVELFRHYYFVNYRTFDQDIHSENFLEPVNMYVVVFREGVLSFHFSPTPHPANVRRRIRQLRDYLILSSDWISYAIIDDITDVFQPLIQNIEDEVDEIDEAILQLHTSSDKRLQDEKSTNLDDATTIADSSGDMLRRVGDCRKRVMSLYRLLGNKADVIKGFAKRCNERWEVAPRSEIGLYLGDIQDHIVTMTSNLSHYEKYATGPLFYFVFGVVHLTNTSFSSRILARSHGNYLAQINIRMNERQEQTADVLGKLTVLGTIVLPMNIITGLWGMNVWVPGQDIEGDLTWFMCITAGLLVFGLACYLIAKRVYNIV